MWTEICRQRMFLLESADDFVESVNIANVKMNFLCEIFEILCCFFRKSMV